ncbi:MAG: putative Ig domain-containing protein [Myxococcota bacterium]|jgi:hypothetical protein|nr:putative Ig domain-containing protein [Myxococcota bacterium]
MTSRPGRWPAPLRGHAALLLLVGGLAAVSLAGCDDAEHPTGLLPLDGGTTDLGEADAAAATDLSPGTLCRPGEHRCWDENKVATCLEEGEGWLVEACPTGEHCPAAGTGCVPRVCVPGTARCADEGEAVLLCTSDGQGWSAAQPCPEAESCLRGVCLPRLCEPGEVLCGRDRLLTCEADGLSWAEEPCPAGQLCFAGACVGCVTDRDCATGEGCVDGGCQPLPLAIRTLALPEGMVGEPYAAPLEAEGGKAPYLWALVGGSLPPGLLLDPGGQIAGTPEVAGEATLTLALLDGGGGRVEQQLLLRIHGIGLAITTESLPVAEEGSEYVVQLLALGGVAPYTWGIGEGLLPAGLSLLSGGELRGVPAESGDFLIDFKVFDDGLPPQRASRALSLRVAIAPLEIVGDQQYDLFVIKVVVLPLITVIEGVPVPYATTLQARGGLRPYRWSEQAIPDYLRGFLPNAGLPEGLTLGADGQLTGAVGSTAQVISLTIPFTQITLNGFFFLAKVEDSQSPAANQSALFLLPTLPLGGQ